MLTEDRIRAIAQRYVDPIRNANVDERRFILENVIREALIAEQASRNQYVAPNAGCL